MGLQYGSTNNYSGLVSGSIGRSDIQESGGSWLDNFGILSSVIEIGVGIVVGTLSLNPGAGAAASFAIGTAFAGARLGVSVAQGEDINPFFTILDFALPSLGAVGSGVTAARQSAALGEVARGTLGIGEAATAIGRASTDVLDDIVKATIVSSGTLSVSGNAIASLDDFARIGISQGDLAQSVGRQLIDGSLSKAARLEIVNSPIFRDFVSGSGRYFDNIKAIGGDVIGSVYSQSTHVGRQLGQTFVENITNLTNSGRFAGDTVIRTLIEQSSYLGSKGVNFINKDETYDLLRQSGVSLEDLLLYSSLLAAAKTQDEVVSITVAFLSSSTKNIQDDFLNLLRQANPDLLGRVPQGVDGLRQSNWLLKESIISKFASATPGKRAAKLGSEAFAKDVFEPSLLQKVLKTGQGASGTPQAGKYVKYMSNYDVLKSRTFYQKVARKVQWLNPTDAARDLTTPIYNKLRAAIKKSTKLKSVAKWFDKLKKFDKISEAFEAAGGVSMDSSWILGYRVVQDAPIPDGKSLIMVVFKKTATSNKAPVFTRLSKKQLLEWQGIGPAGSTSVGRWYLDNIALARNGIRGQKVRNLNTFVKKLGSSAAFLPFINTQLLRTVTSIVSTSSKRGIDLLTNPSSFFKDYIDGFGERVVSSIATRVGRLGGTVAGTAFGGGVLGNIVRREVQRAINVPFAGGVRNVFQGKAFFDNVGERYLQGLQAGAFSIGRTALKRTAGANNYLTRTFTGTRKLNILAGAIRSPSRSRVSQSNIFGKIKF